ncbi:PTS mannose transporter subunit IIA [Lactobacillus sp. ESL0677]|uniref:PTS sugar transporter subunit IIA n=1 Tax=Lactobacillus sp. ESL0677 TaxID=2983208 RepID=UPI0023F8718F|nr:PTS mannose transporter subunit IIA [Lactobacillus sp. ESL0677]WEV37229.1 PTS mannose transporter subunit IIA [Lactobacillus sp. ESL0677]
MKDIILATHGNLAFEFKKTAELIVGHIDNIQCFGMTKDKSAAKGQKELENLIKNTDEDNLIILTDLYGGSSNNICTELLLKGHHFQLLSGLNLPLLLTFLTIDSSNMTSKELVKQLKEAGVAGIIDVSEKIERGVASDD